MLFPPKLFALLLTASAVTYAQTAETCLERTAIVNALDINGVPVTRPAGARFMASRRQKALRISSLQYTRDPNGRVAVLLDTSESMEGNVEGGMAKWEVARSAALDFVSSTPPQTSISLTAFSTSVDQRFDALERQSVKNWLDSSDVRGGKVLKGQTNLSDSILAAVKAFGPSQPGDAVYVITDGAENVSGQKVRQLEILLESSGVRLFAFLINTLEKRKDRWSATDLYELTRRSGGFLVSINPPSLRVIGSPVHVSYYSYSPLWTSVGIPSPPTVNSGPASSGLASVYKAHALEAVRASTHMLQTQISSYYVLSIQFPKSSAGLEDWKLEVVDANGLKRKDVVVAYPNKLAAAACADQPVQP